MKIIDYYTWKTLGELKKRQTISNWCSLNPGYQPHHRFGGGWVVIKW